MSHRVPMNFSSSVISTAFLASLVGALFVVWLCPSNTVADVRALIWHIERS